MNDVETFRLIGSISRRATTEMNQKVNQYGLDNNLFIYLMRIVEHEGITQTDLAHLAQVDKTTLSRALTKLEQKGCVVKRPSTSNQNFKELFPTAKAQEIYNHLAELEQAYVADALKNLTPVELISLNKILSKIKLF